MPQPSYTYRATLDRVIDGDTVILNIDLGFRTTVNAVCRLVGINAPEMSTPDGKIARQATVDWFLSHGPTFIVETLKAPEKYGRWLATIHSPDPGSNQTLNEWLVRTGHAVRYNP